MECYTWNDDGEEMKDKHLGILLAITGLPYGDLGSGGGNALPTPHQYLLAGWRPVMAGRGEPLLISWSTMGRDIYTFKNSGPLRGPFSMLGITGAQFTYFYTVAASSAPTATVRSSWPRSWSFALWRLNPANARRIDLIAVLLWWSGRWLVTNGNFSHLAVTPKPWSGAFQCLDPGSGHCHAGCF